MNIKKIIVRTAVSLMLGGVLMSGLAASEATPFTQLRDSIATVEQCEQLKTKMLENVRLLLNLETGLSLETDLATLFPLSVATQDALFPATKELLSYIALCLAYLEWKIGGEDIAAKLNEHLGCDDCGKEHHRKSAALVSKLNNTQVTGGRLWSEKQKEAAFCNLTSGMGAVSLGGALPVTCVSTGRAGDYLHALLAKCHVGGEDLRIQAIEDLLHDTMMPILFDWVKYLDITYVNMCRVQRLCIEFVRDRRSGYSGLINIVFDQPSNGGLNDLAKSTDLYFKLVPELGDLKSFVKLSMNFSDISESTFKAFSDEQLALTSAVRQEIAAYAVIGDASTMPKSRRYVQISLQRRLLLLALGHMPEISSEADVLMALREYLDLH